MQALKPGSTIGILGAGQLGRMLAVAASQLGFKCRIYSDVPGPASDVAVSTTIGAYEDLAKIAKFAEETDVVTYEFENVPVEAAAAVERVRPVRPGLKALEAAQDRYREKCFIASLGIPIARFASVSGPDDFAAAIAEVGAPAILKTRRLGYDGKGQARIEAAGEIAAAFDAIGSAPATLEALVRFKLRNFGVARAQPQRRDALLRHPDQPSRGRHPAHLNGAERPAAGASGARPRDRRQARRGARLRRRDRRRNVLCRQTSPSRCCSTSSPRACTTAATGPWTPAPSASSRTTSAPSPAGRWAQPIGIPTVG